MLKWCYQASGCKLIRKPKCDVLVRKDILSELSYTKLCKMHTVFAFCFVWKWTPLHLHNINNNDVSNARGLFANITAPRNVNRTLLSNQWFVLTIEVNQSLTTRHEVTSLVLHRYCKLLELDVTCKCTGITSWINKIASKSHERQRNHAGISIT